MTTVFDNTYADKSTAVRGAKRAKLADGTYTVTKTQQGRWIIEPAKADDFEMTDAERGAQATRTEVVAARAGAEEVAPLTEIKTPGDVANADLEKLAVALGPRKESTPEEIKARREARKAAPKADKPKAEKPKKDATQKVPSYKELARMAPEKSKIDKPVAFVREFLAKHYGTRSRKEIVAELVGYGLNLAMCRAQYQMYRNKLKADAESTESK